ncbi:MAG TPA: dihydrofolate reductase family protein [Stackebrandtia sp.]|jgi:dihydrofolate reductase|uniref:dihydrofolate reductase family protein n=1 Tax=Stackebrandtia sp. TaxID=2023065 RepID=UPI002D686171|nr:dihydrofolate reductase family protein [Stackebrandtia sp.]HZE37557.1 dihydrofolate reductase family protein [Stackebrandtia sp.]
MPKTTYVIVSTLNGYVAAADGGLDWLVALDGGDRDISAHVAAAGVIAMGATTYEDVIATESLLDDPEIWRRAHGDRPAWVFTHRELPRIPGANLTFASDVRAAHGDMTRAAGDGDILIAGGGGLAAAFAEAGLLDEIVVGIAPVALAAGRPLFPADLPASRLRLSDVDRRGQLVFLTYRVDQ